MRNPARILRAAILATGVLGGTTSGYAMDYMDGSAVREHGGGDLASLYAFVPNVAGQPGPLALLLAIKPFALSVNEVGRFSKYTDVTEYSIRMRPARIAGVGAGVRTQIGSSELKIACRYFEGQYEISCTATSIAADGTETERGRLGGDIDQVMRTKGLRMATTMRSDPLRTNFHSVLNCMDDDEEEFLSLENFKRRVSPKFRNSVDSTN